MWIGDMVYEKNDKNFLKILPLDEVMKKKDE
jgi:hypothetical protein